jgi:hypothetical protein
MSRPGLDPQYDPALVEAAVLEAVGARGEGREFHAAREGLYTVPDVEARERAFADLHGRWFERLGLHRPFLAALDEQPRIAVSCDRWVVLRARSASEEAADLLAARAGRPTLLVELTPSTTAAPARMAAVLRHELMHVADMLDPDFGYTPELPADVRGTPSEAAVRSRYRVLWGVYVDGRLVRAGRAPRERRDGRLAEFIRFFPETGAEAAARFTDFFDSPRRTHAELLAFALGDREDRIAARCPLCAGPARALVRAHEVPGEAAARIVEEYPGWRPAHGACGRCVEVYVGRSCLPPPRGGSPCLQTPVRSSGTSIAS